MSRRARLRSLLFVSLVGVLLVAGWLWQGFREFADRPLDLPASEVSFTLAPGDGFAAVLAKLRAVGVDAGRDLEWRLLARQLEVDDRLQAGEYAIAEGITPRELLLKMARGEVVQYRFTLVEGWTFRQLRAALSRDEHVAQTLADKSNEEIMAALGRPGLHPEGRFLPETYLFSRNTGDLELLRRMLEGMDAALAEAWNARTPELPLGSPDELLALASIVEKETGAPEERALIAGVFVHRLRVGMRLQTDPTVIYGLGSAYDGDIRRRDLETDTPYNTYTRDGLPPTPIAMPGRAALAAASRPQETDDLFFVAIGDGSGRHVFSATLEEHNAAVADYLRRSR
jgi:UPF0755 protein